MSVTVRYTKNGEPKESDFNNESEALIFVSGLKNRDRHDLRFKSIQSGSQTDTIEHKFDVGDYALDDTEPTPSPEVNTVEVVELIDARADEFEVEGTGKTVAEHNQYYPPDDPVVAGVYPNMNDEKIWHFPESRLRDV